MHDGGELILVRKVRDNKERVILALFLKEMNRGPRKATVSGG